MELLHPYKKASLTQIPIEKPVRESSYGQELIALLFGINDWLSDAISKDALGNCMEWELSLRGSMNQLNFKEVNRNKDFEICDGTEQRRFFGTDMRHLAERALLKILFPINY